MANQLSGSSRLARYEGRALLWSGHTRFFAAVFGFETPMVACLQHINEQIVFLRFSLNILGAGGVVISPCGKGWHRSEGQGKSWVVFHRRQGMIGGASLPLGECSRSDFELSDEATPERCLEARRHRRRATISCDDIDDQT